MADGDVDISIRIGLFISDIYIIVAIYKRYQFYCDGVCVILKLL
jgi:hypothetical protein